MAGNDGDPRNNNTNQMNESINFQGPDRRLSNFVDQITNYNSNMSFDLSMIMENAAL